MRLRYGVEAGVAAGSDWARARPPAMPAAPLMKDLRLFIKGVAGTRMEAACRLRASSYKAYGETAALWQLNQAQFAASLREGGNGLIEIGTTVSGRDLSSYSSLSFGYDWVAEADDIDAAIEQCGGEFVRFAGIADHDGNNGVLAVEQLKSGFGHGLAKVGGVRFQTVPQFG